MDQDVPTKNTTAIGNLGESVAARYLQDKGYDIVERNYWKKWGEIDIVCKRHDRIHFVEVKSVSYETKELLEYAVTHETWRPEEQVHAFKMRQIQKAAETWISEHSYAGDVQVDVIAVRLVPRETFATVNLIENVILEPQTT
jgi:putative endonuclease